MIKSKRCDIPSLTLGTCDLEWGHDGDLHASAGDGFYARNHLELHHQRQHERKKRARKSIVRP